MSGPAQNPQYSQGDADIQYLRTVSAASTSQMSQPQVQNYQQLSQVQQHQTDPSTMQVARQQPMSNPDAGNVNAMPNNGCLYNPSGVIMSNPPPGYIDPDTMANLPQSVLQALQIIYNERTQLQLANTKLFEDCKKLQSQIKSMNERYTGLNARVAEYTDANEAYRLEHERNQATINDLNVELDKQRKHAKSGWEMAQMMRKDYDDATQKLTATKTELESIRDGVNKAHFETTQWRNTAMAWADPKGEWQRAVAENIGKNIHNEYASKMKTLQERVVYLEAYIHQQRQFIAQHTPQNAANAIASASSSPNAAIPPLQYAGQLPSVLPAPASPIVVQSTQRRASLPHPPSSNRKMPPPIDTSATSREATNSPNAQLNNVARVAVQSATTSPHTIATPSSMIQAVADMDLGKGSGPSTMPAGSMSLPATPAAGSNGFPTPNARPATTHPNPITDPKSSMRSSALSPQSGHNPYMPGTRPRQGSAPNIHANALVAAPMAPSTSLPQASPTMPTTVSPSQLNRTTPVQPMTFLSHYPQQAPNPATPQRQLVPQRWSKSPQQSSPSGPVQVAVAPRLKAAGAKRPSVSQVKDEEDELSRDVLEPLAKRQRLEPVASATIVEVPVPAPATVEPSSRASSIETPLSFHPTQHARTASSNISRPPIAVLEPPPPSPKREPMEVETAVPSRPVTSAAPPVPSSAGPGTFPSAVPPQPTDSALSQATAVSQEDSQTEENAVFALLRTQSLEAMSISPPAESVGPAASLQDGEVINSAPSMSSQLLIGQNLQTAQTSPALPASDTSNTPVVSDPEATPQMPGSDDHVDLDSRMTDLLESVFEQDDDGTITCQLCLALPTKRENANEDGPLLSVKDMIEHCRTRHPKVWSHYGQ